MKRLSVWMLAALVALPMAAHAVEAGEESALDVAVGDEVAHFTFKDIRYLPRTMKEMGEADYYVLAFVSSTCPVAQRYLPYLDELYQEYKDDNVLFIGVNVEGHEGIMDASRMAIEYDLSFPVVKDYDGSAVKAIGATRTPEIAIVDKDGVLQYRGRVDDQYRLSGVKPEPSNEELKAVLNALTAGQEVPVKETPVDGCEITLWEPPAPSSELTYADDIARIVNRNCVECHREGTAAPFALKTYQDVATRANMIAEVVHEGRMPPWYAHPDTDEFMNSRRLKDEDREKLIAWARGDKKRGNLAEAPEPPEYPDPEWIIGEPDLFVQAPEPFELPAHGYVDYQYIMFPYQFPEDTWVQGIQIKPSNSRVVHHANLVYLDESMQYKGSQNFLTGLVPGGEPARMLPGHAMLIPKGSFLMLQVHYVTTGKPETDQIGVGLKYADGKIDKQIRFNIVENKDFEIPPGAFMHEVKASDTIEEDVTVLGLFSHMHLRGRDMRPSIPMARRKRCSSCRITASIGKFRICTCREPESFPQARS